MSLLWSKRIGYTKAHAFVCERLAQGRYITVPLRPSGAHSWWRAQRTKLHYKPGTATVVIPAAGLRAYRESLVQTRFTSNQFVSHALPYDHLTRTGHIDPHLLGLFDIDCAKSRQPASSYMAGTRHEINNYRVDIDGPPSATVIRRSFYETWRFSDVRTPFFVSNSNLRNEQTVFSAIICCWRLSLSHGFYILTLVLYLETGTCPRGIKGFILP